MKTARLLLLAGLAGPLFAGPAAPPPTVITSDRMESHSSGTKTVSIFTDHVVVTGNGMKVDCDRLEVITSRIGEGTDVIGKQAQFQYLLATGHVHIFQADREATCGRAEVLPGADKIILTVNPVVTDHGNNSVYTGDQLVLLHGERTVTGTHVRITGPPIKDLGFEKK